MFKFHMGKVLMAASKIEVGGDMFNMKDVMS